MRTLLILTIAGSLLAGVPDSAVAQEAEAPRSAGSSEERNEQRNELAIIQGLSEKSLRPLSPGYVEWMRQHLATAGVSIARGSASRPSAGELEQETDRETTKARLRYAARARVDKALLVDLQRSADGIEIGLRLLDTGTGQLIAGQVSGTTSMTLSEDASRALQTLLPALGHPLSSLAAPSPVTLGELSELGRALMAFDRGQLTLAWRGIAKSAVIGAEELRNEIASAAADPDTALSERARVTAARGDPGAAWSLIAKAAPAELKQSNPDLDMLQAAGEIQIARGRLAEADKYFRHSLAMNARNAQATLGLAKVLTGQNKLDQARSMLERSAALDRDSPTAVTMLGRSEEDPARKAMYLMTAGDREAKRLNPGLANLHYSRAAKADPSVSADTHERSAQLYQAIGETHAARDNYQSAIQQGGPTGPRLHKLAQVQQIIGDFEAAQSNYMRSLDLIGNESQVLTDLGGLYTATGRTTEAVLTLEHASALAPEDPAVKRSLARALTVRNKTGDRDRASQLFVSAGETARPAAQDLMDLASLQREAGDLDGARGSFESALTLQPLSATAQQDLADVIEESGDTAGAEIASARAQVVRNAATSSIPQAAEPAVDATRAQRFEALVQSFVTPDAALETVVLLGIQVMPPETWEDRAWALIRPRKLDVAGLQAELASAIAANHELVAGNLLDSQVPSAITQLFRFASDDSLDPDIIASLNQSLGADAVFIAIAVPRSGDAAAAAGCDAEDSLELQIRKLGGLKSYRVSALSKSACIPAALAATGSWRWQAGAMAGLLVFFVLAPLVRGWGGVVVDFKLPPHTKALFAVSVKPRPRKVKDQSKRTTGPASWAFQKRLQSLSRYERRLEGKRIIFKWIPARRRVYYLTVRGPLLDYTTEQIIGDFLEEKTVRIRRGKMIKLDFDMCPSEAAIEIRVTVGGVEVRQAQVCNRGVAGSLRYASEGSAFIYAGLGDHVLVAADGGSVAEQSVRIESVDPMRVSIDLDNERELVFKDCPEAVEAYMASDFRSAADALERAGQSQAAHRVRVLWHRAQGDRAGEARELAASGQIVASAEILAADTDSAAAGELFEQAGEHKRAADAFRQSGDTVSAARNYEAAYDYENAADCFRELGDSEKVIQLLETTGDFFEAAKASEAGNQLDRAISNYQHVDSRHPRYSEVCRDMGGLLAARGHTDLAIEKFNEALELGGDDALPIETLAAFGKLLEENGRSAEALDIYERVRRRDLGYANITARIDGLKDDATRLAGTTAGPAQASEPAPEPAPEDARYELLDELGRGGMGVVYRARDKHLGRLVAMKFLPDNLQQHPTAVKLFLREARATAALNHPNIVTMYDASQQDGHYFISMECLEGVALDAVLKKRGAIPTKLMAQLGMQVCAGLDYAHRSRIVHRDIKPSNLFVTKERVLKIMDFGLAKAIEEVRRNSTMIGGTPNFMAPEQAAGDRVDERTDLYSLGATLFQLVTGTVPFEDGDVTYHHRHTQAPDARERLATIPAELAETLLLLMAKNPDERIQSAAEVGIRLKQVFENS